MKLATVTNPTYNAMIYMTPVTTVGCYQRGAPMLRFEEFVSKAVHPVRLAATLPSKSSAPGTT